MPIDELPFRSISVCDALERLMAERGETVEDVEWVTPGPYRAADFEHGIMRTKRHVYSIVSDYWDPGGIEAGSGYYPKVFVAKVEDGHG